MRLRLSPREEKDAGCARGGFPRMTRPPALEAK